MQQVHADQTRENLLDPRHSWSMLLKQVRATVDRLSVGGQIDSQTMNVTE